MKDKISFINIFSESFEKKIISKCIISNVNKINSENNEYKSILIRIIETKAGGRLLSWVFKYPTKDITSNFTLQESISKLDQLLGLTFLQADLFLVDQSVHLQYLKNGKTHFFIKNQEIPRKVILEHNRSKSRILDDSSKKFLTLLGVYSKDGFLKKEKTDKYVQINKYLEFFSQVLKESGLIDKTINVMDMGSGKGYLTFAMYQYLLQNNYHNPKVTGVEFRHDMVSLCNSLAHEANFDGLNFEQGTIEDHKIENVDVLVALHACDTATDQALFKGIKAGAKAIMVAPCCHKEIRKQMKGNGVAALFSKFGTLEERTAETLTDLIRCLLLESQGYTVKAFEFISSEHTPKNLMITATKKFPSNENLKKLEQLAELKQMFGIQNQYLETLLETVK